MSLTVRLQTICQGFVLPVYYVRYVVMVARRQSVRVLAVVADRLVCAS